MAAPHSLGHPHQGRAPGAPLSDDVARIDVGNADVDRSANGTMLSMPIDPRRDRRVKGPFEATWSGTSGHRTVRVADFSVGGCFVEDIATPATSERVTLMLRVPGGPAIAATGHVVYVAPPLGFAVAFDKDERLVSELTAAVRRVSQAG